MPNYKKILEYCFNSFKGLDDVIEYYSRDASIYSIKSKYDSHFELVFGEDYSSPVVINRVNEHRLKYATKFYLDDDHIILDVEQMAMIVFADRITQLADNERRIKYKKIHNSLFRGEMTKVFDSVTYLLPYASNNDLKIKNRVRVVKTWYLNRDGDKIYYKHIGDALESSNTPNSREEILEYAVKFNDFISVVSPSEGVYCNLGSEKYRGVGLGINEKEFISHYPVKSNIPERLRQHYTSEYLEPYCPDTDFLRDENVKKEKISAITVFFPAETKYDKFDSPLGKTSLLAGDILISRRIAEKKFHVLRTFNTSSVDVDLIKEGTKLTKGDVLAWDIEGYPDVVYDLKYENAVVDTIIRGVGSYKIIVKITEELGVARVISDYGLKGVTHPRNYLGEIEFDGERMDVDMLIGPNAYKSGSNGVRLAWLAFKNMLEDKTIEVNPEECTEDKINELTSDLRKVKWFYNGYETDVYIGLVSFGPTELAKDCKTNKVRIMGETLKIMLTSANKHIVKVAELLMDKFISKNNKWLLKELLDLKNNKPMEKDIVYDYKDERFINSLSYTKFNIDSWTSVDSNKMSKGNILLSAMNQGFYVKIEDIYVKMPSSKLINTQTKVGGLMISYPFYFVRAIYLLFSIYKDAEYNSGLESIISNIDAYYKAIDNEIFNKKSALTMGISPIVEGGNLKQMVSSLVPRGVTVISDPELESMVFKFKKENELGFVYDIGVRNPVLWEQMFSPKRVWTFSQFKRNLENKNINVDDVLIEKYLSGSVIRNTMDVMNDFSDVDGDLFPAAIPLSLDIQKELHSYYKNPKKVPAHMTKWADGYIQGESDNEKFREIENKPFKYYSIKRSDFAVLFTDSAVAKINVGLGTTDKWKFDTMCEHEYASGNLDYEKMKYLMFLYAKICQSYIVMGIKHNSGGSSGYAPYSSNNFDRNSVFLDLTTNHEVSKSDADLFCDIYESMLDSPLIKILSKMLSGGNPEKMSKKIRDMINVDKHIFDNMSTFTIIRDYYESLMNSIVNISEIKKDLNNKILLNKAACMRKEKSI